MSPLCGLGYVPFVKDRASDKISFTHRPKDMVALTNLYSPSQQLTHVEKRPVKPSESYEREFRERK